VPSYSLPRGYPPNVIIGYYAKDRASFNFTVPGKTIHIGDLTYKLYGFRDMEPEFVPTWIDYPDHACLTGEVTLTITISASDPKTTWRPMPLSTVWTKSSVIYVYAAVEGYAAYYFGSNDVEKDTVTVEVYALELAGRDLSGKSVGNITSSGGLVDNALTVSSWSIDATKTVAIIIRVYYVMEGPRGLFQSCEWFCRGQTRSTTRLGFYVELIPYEYLTAG